MKLSALSPFQLALGVLTTIIGSALGITQLLLMLLLQRRQQPILIGAQRFEFSRMRFLHRCRNIRYHHWYN